MTFILNRIQTLCEFILITPSDTLNRMIQISLHDLTHPPSEPPYRTALWRFGLITNRGIYRMIVLTFLTRLIVQCAYPEKYTPLRVQQQGYPEPLHTIVHLLCNTHKTNFSRVELKVYSCLMIA